MKKYIIIALLIATNVLTIQAQSSMTDDQIISFVLKEQEAGTSQQQIVTKLMQRGVDVSRLRQVKKKYERDMKGKGLGNVTGKTNKATGGKTDDRTRKNNGENQQQKMSPYRIQGEQMQNTYDENDEQWMMM